MFALPCERVNPCVSFVSYVFMSSQRGILSHCVRRSRVLADAKPDGNSEYCTDVLIECVCVYAEPVKYFITCFCPDAMKFFDCSEIQRISPDTLVLVGSLTMYQIFTC